MASKSNSFGRQSALLWVALLTVSVLACGNTRKSSGGPGAEQGGASEGVPPLLPGGGARGGTDAAGGASTVGGAPSPAGGDGGAGGEAGSASGAACLQGAPCACGELTGTLQCEGAGAGADGECDCPPASECKASDASCFEPCGGDASGLWVLQATCFAGAETRDACAGGSISATELESDLRLLVLEDERVVVYGHENMALTARVPLPCLGLDSVVRCADATYYASPLLYSLSTPLSCEPSPCGSCECSGNASGYAHNSLGDPWTAGSPTLSFGGMKVPYCVEGDTLWAGGGKVHGEAKVAYQFQRRSCIGTPVACEERSIDDCGADCVTGRCTGTAPACSELLDEPSCGALTGCQWDAETCGGTASDRCAFDNCAVTPGCTWGAPTARCGGEPRRCHTYDVDDCDKEGCSVRFCAGSDEPQIDPPISCNSLPGSACASAPGCTWSGGVCSGSTSCDKQTDRDTCTLLQCIAYDTLHCGGRPAASCSALSVESCRSEPGCRLEW